ncbi:MAG: protein kinase domain-containing protein [Bryobacteraceae bacterium]|jgi:non-specific serine/threonine protein kinase/serine/threonine-protein kinase
MTSERWAQIKTVLSGALEAEGTQRLAVLDRLCGQDDDLKRNVQSLLAQESRASEVFHSIAAPGMLLREEPPPAAIGAYRVVREIGRGGMGVVYLGERADGEYRKQVAIKLITGGRHDPDTVRRFRRERGILAQLEHPGIARLLDGGATESGQPYFIMEYVEGLPLADYCDRGGLDVPARLGLFLEICDAVSYAHHRLIVHRDLKPGNILVSGDGQTKLLDFGLSRALDWPDSAPEITQAGPLPMTPAYASPEQVLGQPFTVAGDVYSLGVVLYELLSSRRPYQLATGSLLEIARAVCEQEPLPLSQAVDRRLAKVLRGDLENIVAKALAKDAAARYSSVADFAADVRRYLGGQPVAARRATFLYRAGKLWRRHRVAIPAGAVGLGLILAFAGTAWWEAGRAQRRFDDVRGLAHAVMFDLHDAIVRLPGSTPARELLVRQALDYLERLSREAGNNAGLSREIALGYERIADVEGNLSDANLGKTATAAVNLQKSADILERLRARYPADAAIRHDYLRVETDLAGTYAAKGQFDLAMRLSQRNLRIAEDGLRQRPADPVATEEVEAASSSLADRFTEQKRYSEAIPLRERQLDLARKVERANPAGEDGVRSLAVAAKRLAALYGVTGRLAEARKQYETARAIDERRWAIGPSDMRVALDLSYDESDLGWVTGRAGDYAEALEDYRRALELRQMAADADPHNFRATSGVAVSTWKIGIQLKRLGKPAEALEQDRSAIALFERLTANPQASWTTQRDMADVHESAAEALLDLKQPRQAAAEYAASRKIYAALKASGRLPQSQWARIEELVKAEREAAK